MQSHRHCTAERKTYLHDKLDGADKVTQKLEDQVFLFFFHLVEAEFLSPRDDLTFREAEPGVGLQQFFGHGSSSSSFRLLFLLFELTVL